MLAGVLKLHEYNGINGLAFIYKLSSNLSIKA